MLYRGEILSQDELFTKQNILEVGKKEFLTKGFKSASLRKIVKEAGVTTGAFYGYYSNKEALFSDLVEEPAKTVMDKFMEAQIAFSELSAEKQCEQMGKMSGNAMKWMAEYIYDHFDAFKLIICCAEGTKYENYIHKMVEVEVKSTYQFISTLQSLGYSVRKIDKQLCHILASSLFSGFFEMVVHDMEKERAMKYLKDLEEFYITGWQGILGL